MFIVVRAKNTPAAIRGYLRRFLSEADRGLYVGLVSKRVAESLWDKITSEDLSKVEDFRATLIFSSPGNELGFEVKTHGRKSKFHEVEIDGILLFANSLM